MLMNCYLENLMNQHQMYKEIILDGCSIEIGKLSLCCINRYIKNAVKASSKIQFQVHCEHYKMVHPDGNVFSELYDDLDVAIDKFLMLKSELYDRQAIA